MSPSDSTLSRIVTGDVSDNIFGAALFAYGDSHAIDLSRFRQAVTAAVRLAVKGVFASDYARGLKAGEIDSDREGEDEERQAATFSGPSTSRVCLGQKLPWQK
jgi:hypothetical protein